MYWYSTSAAAWLEQAGIPRTKRHRYLGHKHHDVTDIYEDFPVDTFLEQDRQLLRKHVGRVPRAQQGVS